MEHSSFITASAIIGDLSETMMWMPVILMFGIPYMAPLIGMSLLGNMLVFEDRIEKSEPGAGPCGQRRFFK